MPADWVVFAVIAAVVVVVGLALRAVSEPGAGRRRRRDSRSAYGDAGVVGMGAAYGASFRDEDLDDGGGGYVHGGHGGNESGGFGGDGGGGGGDGGGGGG